VKKILIALMFLSIFLDAYEARNLYGEWHTVRETVNGDQRGRESETLQMNPGGFKIEIKMSTKRGDISIKNLTLVASGIWKVHDKCLAIVVEQVRITGVDEVHGVDANSLSRLSDGFRSKYLSDPIRIFSIVSATDSTMTLLGEDGYLKNYRR